MLQCLSFFLCFKNFCGLMALGWKLGHDLKEKIHKILNKRKKNLSSVFFQFWIKVLYFMVSSYGKKISVFQTFSARVMFKPWMRLGVFVLQQILFFLLYHCYSGVLFPFSFPHSLFVIYFFYTKCPHSVCSIPLLSLSPLSLFLTWQLK